MVEVILLLAVFLARQINQVLRQVDVFIIVPVRREVVTVFAERFDPFDSSRRDAFHQERIAVFFEPFMHAQDAFSETAVFAGERRDPELFLAAARADVEDIVFFSPLDFIGLLPGKERHKGSISLFISFLMKIVIYNGFIFQTDFSKFNNSNLPLTRITI